MSRTLRRPMFRGGRVSSYGTGIAAPLVPGYQGGGQIGGGIIYGIPHSDGRYGFQEPTNWKNYGVNQNILDPYIPIWARDADSRGYEIGSDLNKPTNWQSYSVNQNILDQETDKEIGSEGDVIQITKGEEFIEKQEEDAAKKEKADKMGITVAEMDAIEKENLSEEGLKDQKTEQESIAGKIDTSLTNKILNNQNTTDDAELSLEEIKEALGAKKAFGRDVSDMLLTFAGAEGDTVADKFKTFAATEAKKGPSRTEKINEAAATFILKDKLTARSDKRKVDLMKSEVDYKIKAGKEISLAEGVLASTKGTSYSDKKLAGAIQVSTSDNTGEKYKFKGVTDKAGLQANITNGNLKAGDTLIVKETIKVKGQPDKVIKSIVEVVMKDGKLDIQEVYKVT